MTSRPKVSVVVPVYNGGDHLRACLDSIVAQTYSNWTAVIANNCSSDETAEIAEEYSRLDRRIRVIHFQEFVPQAENYNRAVSSASPDADFIKIVEADNSLWPECLERMLEVAMSDDRIGMVGCYYLAGKHLQGGALPITTVVAPGAQVAREHLASEIFYLGCPTTQLFARRALDALVPLFKPDVFYDDLDLCFRLLQHWKFGFVHQVLAKIRHDNEGLMSKFWALDFVPLKQYLLLTEYGRTYFSESELAPILRKTRQVYFRSLGRAIVTAQGPDFWKFHRKSLRVAGQTVRLRDIVLPTLVELSNVVLNPKSSCERAFHRLFRAFRPKRRIAYTFEPDHED